MVVDERSRHQLYRRLEEVLGPEEATTLIQHLPPVGWADVATKHDLAGLEQRVDLRIDAVASDLRATFEHELRSLTATFEHELRSQSAAFEHELRSQSATFGQELRSQTTTMVFGLVGVVLTMAALAFALVRFT